MIMRYARASCTLHYELTRQPSKNKIHIIWSPVRSGPPNLVGSQRFEKIENFVPGNLIQIIFTLSKYK